MGRPVLLGDGEPGQGQRPAGGPALSHPGAGAGAAGVPLRQDGRLRGGLRRHERHGQRDHHVENGERQVRMPGVLILVGQFVIKNSGTTFENIQLRYSSSQQPFTHY